MDFLERKLAKQYIIRKSMIYICVDLSGIFLSVFYTIKSEEIIAFKNIIVFQNLTDYVNFIEH